MGEPYKRSGSPFYWHRFRDENGAKCRESLKTTDKQIARRLAAERERNCLLARAGLGDRYGEHRKRPTLEHAADYIRFLTDGGTGADHAARKTSALKTMIEGAGFKTLPDISDAKLLAFLSARQADPNARFGPTTRNHWLVAMRGLSRWLYEQKRIAEDPLRSLKKVRENRARKRGLSVADAAAVVRAARAARPKSARGLDGEARSLLYVVLLNTGFRASEAAAITPAHCRFDDRPRIVLGADKMEETKSRRRAEQALHPAVAAALQAFIRQRRIKPGEPVWPGGWSDDGADVLNRDMAAAGLPLVDADGRKVGLHGLRVTAITWTYNATKDIRQTQLFARHQNITLTMTVYNDESLLKPGNTFPQFADCVSDCVPPVVASRPEAARTVPDAGKSEQRPNVGLSSQIAGRPGLSQVWNVAGYQATNLPAAPIQ